MPIAFTATEAPMGPSFSPASNAALKSPRWKARQASCRASASASASSLGAALPAAFSSAAARLASGKGSQSPACSFGHAFFSASPA